MPIFRSDKEPVHALVRGGRTNIHFSDADIMECEAYGDERASLFVDFVASQSQYHELSIPVLEKAKTGFRLALESLDSLQVAHEIKP